MSPLWILLTLLPVLGGAERFNCKGRILGAYYADAKSGCKAFHVCVRVAGGGIRDFRFFCPPGTLFHQEAQTCTDWGDDDPLACPADIYDGQFDLYRIGSGYDTKKVSSANRDEEAEYGLQRAETGDRRLSQQNVASNAPASDLRAAHSSDFFSGQRERGRDEAQTSAPVQPPSSPQSRQSFRRPTTQRTLPTSQYTTTPPPPVNNQPPQPQPTNPPQYEGAKRKLVRKRPIYVTTKAPTTTFQPNTQPQQIFSEPPQNFNRRPANPNRQFSTPNLPPQFKEYKDEYVEVSRVTPKQNRYYPSNPPSTSTFPTSTPRLNKKEGLVELYNYDSQSTPALNNKPNDSSAQNKQPFKLRNSFSVSDARDTEFARKKNYNNFNNNVNVNNNNNINTNTESFNANNNNFNNNEINNKFNNNDFNNNNNYNNEFNNNGRDAPTTDYIITTRRTPNTTPAYKNFNSVPYDSEKNNVVPFSKQKYYNNPTTTSVPTTIYTTLRPDPPSNLNTIAYNTNNAFQTQATNNYADGDEDDGQYHPPSGEDDGQYKPEIYDRELLTGAHSINIAASGNRFTEERKQYAKTQAPRKPVAQTAAPRPFRPAPTPTLPPTTRAPEPTTTFIEQTTTQRSFDYVKTYTTTSRPTDFVAVGQNFANDSPAKPTTTYAPRVSETRPTRPPTRPPTTLPVPVYKPTTRKPNPKPPNKEDSSYDYAYYDSDPGFSEYDQIEEFGKTKTKA